MTDVSAELRAELRALGATQLEAASVVEELTGLTALAAVAPAPSAELAALLGRTAPTPGGLAPVVRPSFGARTRRRARRSGAVSSALVLALSGVGATGISAAANSLPAPLQQRVSELSRSYLPFQFPAPTVRPVPGPAAPDVDEPRPAARERQQPLRPLAPVAGTLTASTPAPEVLPADVDPGPEAPPRAGSEPARGQARPSRSSAGAGSSEQGRPAAPSQTPRPRSGTASAPADSPAVSPPPSADPATPQEPAPEYGGRPPSGVTAGAPPRPTVRPLPGEPWQPAPYPTKSLTATPPALAAPPAPTPTAPAPTAPAPTAPPQAEQGDADPEAVRPEGPPDVPAQPRADPTDDPAP